MIINEYTLSHATLGVSLGGDSMTRGRRPRDITSTVIGRTCHRTSDIFFVVIMTNAKDNRYLRGLLTDASHVSIKRVCYGLI